MVLLWFVCQKLIFHKTIDTVRHIIWSRSNLGENHSFYLCSCFNAPSSSWAVFTWLLTFRLKHPSAWCVQMYCYCYCFLYAYLADFHRINVFCCLFRSLLFWWLDGKCFTSTWCNKKDLASQTLQKYISTKHHGTACACNKYLMITRTCPHIQAHDLSHCVWIVETRPSNRWTPQTTI